MKINLSGRESQLLRVIFRQTYGWHKEDAAISLSVMSNSTGLLKTNCSQLMASLEKKRIISVTGFGNRGCKKYRVNKNTEEWLSVTESGNYRKRNEGLLNSITLGLLDSVSIKEKKKKTSKEISKGKKSHSTQTATTEEQKKIANLSDQLKAKNNNFNAYAFLNKYIKSNIPPSVIITVLKKMISQAESIQDFWAYGSEILKKDFSQYSYAKHLEQHYRLKNEPINLSCLNLLKVIDD